MANLDPRRTQLLHRITDVAELVSPHVLQRADLFFDLAGEDIGRRLLLTNGPDGTTYCMRPEFTLPIAVQYLASENVGQSQNFGYLGPVFRQRNRSPFEFDQAGLEFMAPEDSDKAFSQVMRFALEALDLYGEEKPLIHLGSVDLFEALLAKLDLPDVWRPRVRDRFGNGAAISRLLDRLAKPVLDQHDDGFPKSDAELVTHVSNEMDAAGLSPYSGRKATEIVQRYREKQTLEDAAVAPQTVRILREFLAISGPANKQISRISKLAETFDLDLVGPLERLQNRLAEITQASPKAKVEFDAGFSPSLDYYTGHVFELVSNATGGVLASGGQYDRLLERMGAPNRISAVGCSVWLDRLEKVGAQ